MRIGRIYTPIRIAKLGGIRQDHSAYDLPEGDFLPDEGEFYIFEDSNQSEVKHEKHEIY